MKSNKFYFGILLLIFLFGSVSASYATSSVQFTQPGIGSSFLGSGTTSEVNFNSEPQKAEVFVNGQSMGVTPIALKLESKKTYSPHRSSRGQR